MKHMESRIARPVIASGLGAILGFLGGCTSPEAEARKSNDAALRQAAVAVGEIVHLQIRVEHDPRFRATPAHLPNGQVDVINEGRTDRLRQATVIIDLYQPGPSAEHVHAISTINKTGCTDIREQDDCTRTETVTVAAPHSTFNRTDSRENWYGEHRIDTRNEDGTVSSEVVTANVDAATHDATENAQHIADTLVAQFRLVSGVSQS